MVMISVSHLFKLKVRLYFGIKNKKYPFLFPGSIYFPFIIAIVSIMTITGRHRQIKHFRSLILNIKSLKCSAILLNFPFFLNNSMVATFLYTLLIHPAYELQFIFYFKSKVLFFATALFIMLQ